MTDEKSDKKAVDRRCFLKGCLTAAAASAVPGCNLSSAGSDAIEEFLQSHFREMSKTELREVLARLERKYSREYGKDVEVKATPPMENVQFAYALDLSRCIGCRRCVHACVDENNQSRDPEVQWIKVLEMDKAKGIDFEHSTAYYDPETVPEEGKFYLPVACQQCENPPCVKVCPVEATWKDKDGIVVIDYDWCIGCRCCVTACPYGARRYNWTDPEISAEGLNPNTEYLGNRPRPSGVVEKCIFCLHRVRQGLYPRCVEACPVGARKFGNLLDPESEIRKIIEQKRIFLLKEDLNTQPKFFYFYGT